MRDLVLATALLLAGPAAAGEGGFDASKLPVNQWVKLPTNAKSGYMWAQHVYAPSRGQLLHWGAIGSRKVARRNDVAAFDAAKGTWVGDYAPAKKLPDMRGSRGIGVYYRGRGAMLPCGTPAPSYIVNGACWDSKRKQVVYTMRGLMAAYDPEKRTWKDLKAKTVIGDKEHPGGPPVYGVGTGYDPVNDEIVMFPHFGAVNRDMVPVTGRVNGHLGTLRYSFKGNTWRRVGYTFGSEDVKRARKDLLVAMALLSHGGDLAYGLKRRGDFCKPAAATGALARAVVALGKLKLPGGRGEELLTAAADEGKKATAAAKDARWNQAVTAAGRALWKLDLVLEGALRVEPPARCAAPMIYDPKQEAIVMHGGFDGLVRTDLRRMGRGPTPPGLGDTWLYDVKTRQWRELVTKGRPPDPGRFTNVFRDPVSGMLLKVVRCGAYDKKKFVTVYGLDLEKAQWFELHRQEWKSRPGSWWGAGLDEKAGLLALTQVDVYDWPQCIKGQETHVLRLDVASMARKPLADPAAAPPVKYHAAPPDDPAWLAKLKGLPANKWVHVRPKRDADTRDWGNAACDAVRGHLYYFGGGHSTYQVNDVAIFSPAAGKWAFAAGDTNDWVPPVGWGGSCMGLRGGSNAHHMRNSYVAVDGRMYKSAGASSRRWGAESAKLPGKRYCHFYDLDRGGVWRQMEVKVERGQGVPGTWGSTHMATPDGRVIGFGGTLEPYDGRFFASELYFNSLDIYTNELTIRKVSTPHPGFVYEVRPFCFMPDKGKKGQVFFYEYVGKRAKTPRAGTWVYDIESNKFTKLSPKRQPSGNPGTVVHIAGQNAVFAIINRKDQWVYSFEKNDWAQLPLESDAKIGFAGPYTQLVYSAKYGVLINTGNASRGVAVMRPDVSKAKW